MTWRCVEFRVGRPWGKTAFVTGWGARDEQFDPVIREFYYTSTYAGIEHQFSNASEFPSDRRVSAGVAGRARSSRSRKRSSRGKCGVCTRRATGLEASSAYSRNMGFHAYDAVQSGFAVSYAMPSGAFKEESGEVALRYPIRFSAGCSRKVSSISLAARVSSSDRTSASAYFEIGAQ